MKSLEINTQTARYLAPGCAKLHKIGPLMGKSCDGLETGKYTILVLCDPQESLQETVYFIERYDGATHEHITDIEGTVAELIKVYHGDALVWKPIKLETNTELDLHCYHFEA